MNPPERKPLSKRTRFEIFKRDGFACMYCGATPPQAVLHVDHITPVVDGGDNDPANLITACQDCNLGKNRVPLSKRPKPLLDATESEQEKLDQLKAYTEMVLERHQAQERIVYQLCLYFAKLENISLDEYYVPPDLINAFRRFLKLMPIDAIMDAMNITHDRMCGLYGYDAFKYFCGVCWKKIRATEPKPKEDLTTKQ